MNSRQRFHLTSIVAILITVLVVYSVAKKPPEQQQQVRALGSRFIMIFEASWGVNCNEFIQQTIINRKARAAKYPVGEAPEPVDGQPKELLLQEPNNALLKLSEMCNTRETCVFKASAELFGEPYKTCNKALDILYRCFEYDRIHEIHGYEGQEVRIDCTQQEPTTEPNSPA